MALPHHLVCVRVEKFTLPYLPYPSLPAPELPRTFVLNLTFKFNLACIKTLSQLRRTPWTARWARTRAWRAGSRPAAASPRASRAASRAGRAYSWQSAVAGLALSADRPRAQPGAARLAASAIASGWSGCTWRKPQPFRRRQAPVLRNAWQSGAVASASSLPTPPAEAPPSPPPPPPPAARSPSRARSATRSPEAGGGETCFASRSRKVLHVPTPAAAAAAYSSRLLTRKSLFTAAGRCEETPSAARAARWRLSGSRLSSVTHRIELYE